MNSPWPEKHRRPALELLEALKNMTVAGAIYEGFGVNLVLEGTNWRQERTIESVETLQEIEAGAAACGAYYRINYRGLVKRV